jgi:translation initiation factor IF-2
MEETKTELVEKRLSRGVIRRRSRKSKEADAAAVAAKPEGEEVKKDDKVVVTAKVADAPKKAVETKKVEEEKAPSKEEGLTLSSKQKQQAAENVEKNLKPVEVVKEAKVEAKAEAVVAKEVVIEPEEKIIRPKEKVVKKEEKKKVLSFKDRIRGTISLDKLKKPVKKVDAAKPKVRASGNASFGPGPSAAAAAEQAKKEKAAKVKKGVKNIGGDLDIEGLGRATHLNQLTRTSTPDRVFRPGAGGARRGGRGRKKIVSRKNVKATLITEKKASKRVIIIEQAITVGNLAQQLGVKAGEIIKHLMDLGIMATINQEVEKDTVQLIANEYQYELKDKSFKEDAVIEQVVEDDTDKEARPPIVTVMGHVDHGKTSLLDAIRETNVTSGEAGGITQHIGAYTISLPQGKVTFLDTPGHEAFTTMRSRGAQVTDIVILVVAADDGMMPQTIESIDHAKAAGVPIVVAVNKIDKEDANPEDIKRQLSEKGLLPEEWGGDTMFLEVSALNKTGINELLENVLLQAEVLDLKANHNKRAGGTVIEAKLDRSRGHVCTLLVQNGELKTGDYVVAGTEMGRIRAMLDWEGSAIDSAGPSIAAEVLGFESVPEPGDQFDVVVSEQDGRKVIDSRKQERLRKSQSDSKQVTLEDMFSQIKEGEVNKLNIVLKADTQGSLEAVRESVMKIGNEEVQANIIHAGVGGINESDVTLAMTSKAVIIGFTVRPETNAIHLAKEKQVDVRLYKIIYELVNEVKLAMQGLLKPDIVENYLGRAEVRQAFQVSKLGVIAGSMVVDGVITRSANLRLLRENVVIFEGKITSLKRFKDDAKDVKQGFECGIGIEGHQDIKEGDVIEAFELQEIQKTL